MSAPLRLCPFCLTLIALDKGGQLVAHATQLPPSIKDRDCKGAGLWFDMTSDELAFAHAVPSKDDVREQLIRLREGFSESAGECSEALGHAIWWLNQPADADHDLRMQLEGWRMSDTAILRDDLESARAAKAVAVQRAEWLQAERDQARAELRREHDLAVTARRAEAAGRSELQQVRRERDEAQHVVWQVRQAEGMRRHPSSGLAES